MGGIERVSYHCLDSESDGWDREDIIPLPGFRVGWVGKRGYHTSASDMLPGVLAASLSFALSLSSSSSLQRLLMGSPSSPIPVETPATGDPVAVVVCNFDVALFRNRFARIILNLKQ